MKQKTILAIAAFAIASSSAFAYEGSKLEKQASIKMADAEKIALKAFNGKIEKKELERENGKLRYSFEIEKGEITHEVAVDAKTGKVVENKIED